MVSLLVLNPLVIETPTRVVVVVSKVETVAAAVEEEGRELKRAVTRAANDDLTRTLQGTRQTRRERRPVERRMR